VHEEADLMYLVSVESRGPFDTALSRHQRERERDQGATLLSVLRLPTTPAAAEVGRWAMSRHMPLALIGAASLEDAIGSIVQSISAARVLQEARQAIASASGRRLDAIDASLAARTISERRKWLDELATVSPEIKVAEWALTAYAGQRPLDVITAPVRLEELATLLIALGGPVAVLVASDTSSAQTLIATISLAAALASRFPRLPVCLAAPGPAFDEMLASASESASIAMARQGCIDVIASDQANGGAQSAVAAGRSRAERYLHDALNRDPRTRGRFALSAALPILFSGRQAEVDLYDRELALAVEVDGWHHFRDPESYRRDRRKEIVLQRAGVFVMRFLEQDVWDRLEYLIDQVADAVAFRCTTQSAAHRPQ
jgi:very-short-patch-repair endonuclease